MNLSPTLIEAVIMFAIGGLCFWLWNLKSKTEELKTDMHELKLELVREYARKTEMKEVMADALAPLKEVISELKQEVRHTIRKIDELRLYGGPE